MASDAVVGAQAVAGAGYQSPNVECKNATHATVERLLVNDPDVAGLIISDTDGFLDLNVIQDESDQIYKMAAIGRAISKSTHLRKLEVNGHRHGLKCFFDLLARNRSIEHLTIYMVKPADADVDIISILAPFFEHNTNLRCLEIMHTDISCHTSTIITTLSKSGANRLERLCLEGAYFGDERAANLINGLSFMPGLHNLIDLDLGWNRIQRQGLMALSSLLTNSECRIHLLGLSHNQLDIESICSLIKGLVGNKYLKTLHIPNCELDSTGWIIFMAFLSSPSCPLENIEIHDENINDQCAATLGNSLAVNEILKSLQIFCRHITPTGWRHFLKFLKAPTTSLVDLKLHFPDINDEVGIYMFSALANNTSLKRLTLSLDDDITSTGWVECFRQLIGSKSALEELFICSDSMDDEGAAMMVDVISKHMSTFTNIFVPSNYSVTAEGWRLFAEVLHPSSSSKLTHMRIGNNNEDQDEESDKFITDDVALDLFDALANNTCLQELDIDQVTVSSRSLDALARVLCDKTTIANTWQSNHTLTEFKCGYWVEFPTELATLLKLNMGKDKAEVARKKILMYSVLDEEAVCHVFAPMTTTVLPTAIEWIGRDRLGFSAMYYLVQNIPSLIEQKTIFVASDSAALESPHKRRKGG